jgi:hypothetical protein
MRQFPYAQRTHPSSAYRGDATQQQQQQQQSQPQRDTMSDMQEQFSKLAESTSRFPPELVSRRSYSLSLSSRRLFGIRARCFRFNTARAEIASPYFVAGKRTFSSLVSKVKAKVQDYDQQRYAGSLSSPPVYSPSPRLLRTSAGPRAREEDGRGEKIALAHAFTHTSMSYRNTPNTSSSSGTGATIATGYAAQPPSSGVDRHAQQAYYAPRVSPNPQLEPINNDFES